MIAYNYDLISGKVNMVQYQPPMWKNGNLVYPQDYFVHRYQYDAENRLTDVETSRDKLVWEKDARYFYYKHGPLARTILGQNQVQGIDYAYTLQGWLKGVNSTAVGDGSFDMGGDGKAGGGNSNIGRDEYGFALSYYNNDYSSISSSIKPFANASAAGFGFKALYNGNIAAMGVNIPKVGEPLLYTYTYDQLNRITKMFTYKGLNPNTNSWNVSATQNYREQISYDANGNIKTYKRNGDDARSNANSSGMDDLTYTYKPNTNQLDKVLDVAPDVADDQYDKYNDIKKGQQTGNYLYDEIGNLISDESEKIDNISWTVYGKINTITKRDGSTITYTYDASGNRISKTAGGKETYYIRDASGNVMSIYTKDASINNGDLTQTQIHLYGSSRLGVYNLKNSVQDEDPNPGRIRTFTRGNKFFELSNHLGNVLATVSDKKLQHSTDNATVDYFTADVVSANDYYPFGMLMPGRKFQTNSVTYRFGFNSHEKSDEISGLGNHTTAFFGEYDTRLARRWNTDPSPNTSFSGYSIFRNNPIWNNDILLDTPTAYQSAQMSIDSYNKFENRQKIDGGWERIQSVKGVKFEDKRTDFQSALYSRTVNGKTEFTYATAGTASGKDAWQDAIQSIGASGQYAFSIEQAKALNGLLQGQELTFTGHSLGGGTASANALATGNAAITFNAAGISLLTKAHEGLLFKSSSNIRAFIIPGEAVDYYQGIIKSSAEGQHEYVHPWFGKMGSLTTKIVKATPQTIFVRGKLHMMSSMFSALKASGYSEESKMKLERFESRKSPQGADNTINRQGVPVFLPLIQN